MTSKRIVDALWPVALLWIVLIAFALWQDANWPEGTRRIIAFVALAVVATLFVLLPTMMVRRMHEPDTLTMTLSFAFATVALMPFYLMAVSLWPAFFGEHRFSLTVATAGVLIAGSGVAILALTLTPDEGSAREQRAEGVIEGYAQGVADEKHDQYDREMAGD